VTDPRPRLEIALADRYTIERELGRGGMATVYLAHDRRYDRPVALKLLRPELAAILGADRFLREIRLTAQLQHPHILPLLDSGEADGLLYYVMPCVTGESLRQRLTRAGPLPPAEALAIVRAVAAALDYAHAAGVIHRDIKPENILLHEGEPMLADFGIALARSAADSDRITGTGISIGTPAYMSPEQATAEALDRRSDVYSLGCVLYEMLAGAPPFTGATAQAVIALRPGAGCPRRWTTPSPGPSPRARTSASPPPAPSPPRSPRRRERRAACLVPYWPPPRSSPSWRSASHCARPGTAAARPQASPCSISTTSPPTRPTPTSPTASPRRSSPAWAA
jgi:serine/threonine protein kinase